MSIKPGEDQIADAAEGNPWYRVVRADLFILSLLATATFALIWSALQAAGVAGWSTLFFGLFIFASTVLFGGVLWSKFAQYRLNKAILL